MGQGGHVYMMSDKPRGVICTGVTSYLKRRVSEHRQKLSDGYTRRYNATSLVWYERHFGSEAAIAREKALKKYSRDWKINLIEAFNPAWNDLFDTCEEVDNLHVPTFEKKFADGSADSRHGGRG